MANAKLCSAMESTVIATACSHSRRTGIDFCCSTNAARNANANVFTGDYYRKAGRGLADLRVDG